MKNNTFITKLASGLVIGIFAMPTLAEDRGDRIDERLDNKGERMPTGIGQEGEKEL